MIIVGLTGPIGHGKSTFAKALGELEPKSARLESGLIVGEVANALHDSTKTVPKRDDLEAINKWLRPLPAILLEVVKTRVDFSKLKIEPADIKEHPRDYEKLFLHLDNLNNSPELLKQTISHDNKEAYRPILQWLGGYLVKKVDPQIWYGEIIRRAYALADKGVKLCVISGLRFPADGAAVQQADGKIIKVYRPGHLQYDMLDPTERERDDITPDCVIISDADLKSVKICARQVYRDLENSSLQAIYTVSQVVKNTSD